MKILKFFSVVRNISLRWYADVKPVICQVVAGTSLLLCCSVKPIIRMRMALRGVYKHQNIGKLVGMPVPGTMTSVSWETLQDPSLVFGIPIIGYRLPDGSYLENTQLEPDIKVANSPETVVKGEDTQLKMAVDELLKEIDSRKK